MAIRPPRSSSAPRRKPNLGKLEPPISRGPGTIEFYDAQGTPIDVKTPPSPGTGDEWTFNLKTVSSVLGQVRKHEPNGVTKELEFVHVLLDTSYMKADDYAAFLERLMKEASPDELARIIQINVQL